MSVVLCVRFVLSVFCVPLFILCDAHRREHDFAAHIPSGTSSCARCHARATLSQISSSARSTGSTVSPGSRPRCISPPTRTHSLTHSPPPSPLPLFLPSRPHSGAFNKKIRVKFWLTRCPPRAPLFRTHAHTHIHTHTHTPVPRTGDSSQAAEAPDGSPQRNGRVCRGARAGYE